MKKMIWLSAVLNPPPGSHRWTIAISTSLVLLSLAPAHPVWAHSDSISSTPLLTLDKSQLPSSQAPDHTDLSTLSLEDLMNVQVTSVSKHAQKISEAPAAISVISQDDIRRSGMNTIPDILRLAPGVHVAQISNHEWSVGARGSAQPLTNNLLVLMDGRTLYNPLFSGVYWDTVDYILADLDRIEVIRGPGATLWGANAVNGVINITSKSAKDTQGFHLENYTGTDGYTGGLRYGGKVDDSLYFRIYGKYRSLEDLHGIQSDNTQDGMDYWKTGFRIDWDATERDTFMFQANGWYERSGYSYHHLSLTSPYMTGIYNPVDSSGADVTMKWSHAISENSDFSVQLYYDRFNRPTSNVTYEQDTYDLEFQHRFGLLEFQEITWGLGYRSLVDSTSSDTEVTSIRLNPSSSNDFLANGFIQDDITIVPSRFHVIFGTKLEYTSYTNLEYEPSTRFLYTPDEKNTFWLAFSRAVRTPARYERDGQVPWWVYAPGTLPGFPSNLPVFFEANGTKDIGSENYLTLEGGYRVEPIKQLSLDLTGYYSWVSNMIISKTGSPYYVDTPTPHIFYGTEFVNGGSGHNFGFEFASNYQVMDNWRLRGSYSFNIMELNSRDNNLTSGTFSSPSHSIQMESFYNITKDLEVNLLLFFNDRITSPGIPSYWRGDANLVWRPEKHTEIMAGVRNIFDNRHPEGNDPLIIEDSQPERTFFIQLNVNF